MVLKEFLFIPFLRQKGSFVNVNTLSLLYASLNRKFELYTLPLYYMVCSFVDVAAFLLLHALFGGLHNIVCGCGCVCVWMFGFGSIINKQTDVENIWWGFCVLRFCNSLPFNINSCKNNKNNNEKKFGDLYRDWNCVKPAVLADTFIRSFVTLAPAKK